MRHEVRIFNGIFNSLRSPEKDPKEFRKGAFVLVLLKLAKEARDIKTVVLMNQVKLLLIKTLFTLCDHFLPSDCCYFSFPCLGRTIFHTREVAK